MFQNNFWLNNQGNGGFIADLVNGGITGNTVVVTLFSPKEELLEKKWIKKEEIVMGRLWDDYGTILEQLNERQMSAIKHVIRHSKITREEYIKLFGVGKSTAHRDLKGLVDKMVFGVKGKGRARYYVFKRGDD